jgi:hypothetical protein
MLIRQLAITEPSVAISFDLVRLSIGAIDSFAAIAIRVKQLGP